MSELVSRMRVDCRVFDMQMSRKPVAWFGSFEKSEHRR